MPLQDGGPRPSPNDIAAGVLLVNYAEEAAERQRLTREEVKETGVLADGTPWRQRSMAMTANGDVVEPSVAQSLEEITLGLEKGLPAWMNLTTSRSSVQWRAAIRYMDLALAMYTWPPMYLFTLWAPSNGRNGNGNGGIIGFIVFVIDIMMLPTNRRIIN